MPAALHTDLTAARPMPVNEEHMHVNGAMLLTQDKFKKCVEHRTKDEAAQLGTRVHVLGQQRDLAHRAVNFSLDGNVNLESVIAVAAAARVAQLQRRLVDAEHEAIVAVAPPAC